MLGAATGNDIDSLVRVLDSVLDRRPEIIAAKEAELDSLRHDYAAAKTDDERFEAAGQLFDSFKSFSTDSAYRYTIERERIARRTGNPHFIANALMNRADILCSNGMYKETLDIMNGIRRSDLPDYLHPYYFHILHTTYTRLADYASFGNDRDIYQHTADAYRDSLLTVNDPSTFAYAVLTADHYNATGEYDRVIDTLTDYIGSHDTGDHELAILSWILSEAYRNKGDHENRKRYAVIAATGDMRSATLEYVALRQLALMLSLEGDLERTYRYLTVSVDDAARCNVRQRIIELNESYPLITKMYIDKIESQKHRQLLLLLAVSVLFVGLAVTLVFMRRQMLSLAHARKQIEESNTRLNTLNEQLLRSNAELSKANGDIAEASRVKEVYIARYMDQCLDYIERLDSYRRAVNKFVKHGKDDELRAYLKSTQLIDDELDAFYDNFDTTFLKLYPTFVNDFNGLLAPGEALEPRKDGSLTAELRIFALIRLGITDSRQIAKFLRYSLTTIYNYRTKIRNKARGDRNNLEAEVMLIGRYDLASAENEAS